MLPNTTQCPVCQKLIPITNDERRRHLVKAQCYHKNSTYLLVIRPLDAFEYLNFPDQNIHIQNNINQIHENPIFSSFSIRGKLTKFYHHIELSQYQEILALA